MDVDVGMNGKFESKSIIHNLQFNVKYCSRKESYKIILLQVWKQLDFSTIMIQTCKIAMLRSEIVNLPCQTYC